MKNSLILLIITTFGACSTSGPGLFSKRTPHEQYSKKISDAGLEKSALGRAWLNAAQLGLNQPTKISIPYKERGYFAADKPQSTGLRFSAKRGEKLNIVIEKRPSTGFVIYTDLWRTDEINKHNLIEAPDTNTLSWQYEVERDGTYILRIQPELLQSGEYNVSISSGPSLAYPIKAPGKNHIQSFWGDPRDEGGRSHEGIDLFAAKHTPVVAAANGRVVTVNENNLGGKVVWLRPFQKNYTLYYAHLDSQLVREGQEVRIGDTLGLMGNTGNARYTLPHLHFGIYGNGGATDPLPFVNPIVKIPPEIRVKTDLLGEIARTGNSRTNLHLAFDEKELQPATLDPYTPLNVEALSADYYKVSLPNGNKGFIKSINQLNPLREIEIKTFQPLFESPDSTSARKLILEPGSKLDLLGNFNDFQLVKTKSNQEGWIRK